MDEDADMCLYIMRIPHEMKGFDIISFSHTMSIYVQRPSCFVRIKMTRNFEWGLIHFEDLTLIFLGTFVDPKIFQRFGTIF